MEIVVDRHIEDVFAFVADPRHEPRWRSGVLAVEGDEPGPGARHEVTHKRRLRAPRRTTRTCIAWEPPTRIAWRDDDGIETTIALEPAWTATRIVTAARRADLNALKRALERG